MLVKDNWLRFSWDGQAKRMVNENVLAEIIKPAAKLVDFNQACNQVAVDIANCYDNLYLSLSGGCDSEAVADALHRNHVKFTPVIFVVKEFHSDGTAYEFWYAQQWCKKRNITPTVVEVSISEIQQAIFKKYIPQLKARIPLATIPLYVAEYVTNLGGNLITGNQLEYYPDSEQMTYLEPELNNYNGFVLQESDLYVDTVFPDRHPLSFFYWTPEIVAGFVNAWSTEHTMQENKSMIYNVLPRPKFLPGNILTEDQRNTILRISKNMGTTDVFCFGNKETFLNTLVIS